MAQTQDITVSPGDNRRRPFWKRARKDSADHVSEAKSQPLVALELSRRASFTPTTFSSLVQQGYRRNPVVYRCIRLIAEASASVPLAITGSRAQEVNQLINSGSPMQAAGSLREQLFGQLQIAGSAFVEATLVNDAPAALRSIRPDLVEVAEDRLGRMVGWRVECRPGTHRLVRMDPVTHRCTVMGLHLLDFAGSTAGHGPLEACAHAVDIHNEGARWTKALLDNSARPSGALVYKGATGGERLTDAQFERLKSELEQQHSGARSAGRPLLLEGGLDWQSMSMSPADMDFIEARREAAREIAFAFGVPPMLLGIPGDNTYSNYREANHAFWRDSILPGVARFASALQDWLRPWFGEDITIDFNATRLVALSSEREALWRRVSQADFLSNDEKRAVLGLAPSGGET